MNSEFTAADEIRMTHPGVSPKPHRTTPLPVAPNPLSETVHTGRRGFTLIELLVVIAIIGILAAILFPVLSRVKLAAKATTSMSNVQQIAAGLQLYMGDYDSTVVPSGEWGSSAATEPFQMPGSSSAYVATWPWLLNPYLKSGPLTQDTMAPLNGPVLAGGNQTSNDLFFPQYGMNYVYLTPYDATNELQHPVSTNMITQMGKTIFAVGKYAYPETKLGTNGYVAFDDVGSPALWTTVEVPDCATADSDNLHACKANWGAADGYINDATVVGITTAIAGSNTGGASLRTVAGDGLVAFMDGHVKQMAPGLMASGTNWTPTLPSNMVITVDPTKYLWGLQ